MTIDTIHHFKNPAELTPYEQKLWDLKSKGLNYQQMSEALNGTSKINTIAARFKIIREKLELRELEKKWGAL